MSIAASCWHIVVTTQRDVTQLTLRGPETRATVTPIPADVEFFGIVFSLGAFMPAVPPASLVDRAVTLPAASPNSVWLDGSRWRSLLSATPTCSSIGWSVRLMVRDPVVAASFHDDVDGVSTRTLQRRVPGRRGSPAARSGRSPGLRRPSRRSGRVYRSRRCPPARLRRPSPPHPIAEAIHRTDARPDQPG